MSDETPFYSPDRRPAPPRQPKPGEQVWCLRKDGRIQTCELRDDSKVGAGWDVLVLEGRELIFSRRCADEKGARFVAARSKATCCEPDGPSNDEDRFDHADVAVLRNSFHPW
jgi:hypothetical protein